jgi:hypothetical protein
MWTVMLGRWAMGLRIGFFKEIVWGSGLVLDVYMCDAGFGTGVGVVR